MPDISRKSAFHAQQLETQVPVKPIYIASLHANPGIR